jgi:RimJ/RimL family protein N-acetyltransferase
MIVERVTLEGRHVLLQPLSVAHIPGLALAGPDPDIWRYMPYGDMSAPESMVLWVNDLLNREAHGTDRPFAVVHRESGAVAGATRYMDIRPEHRALEIGGTWYAARFQHSPVNTEAKYLLLRHAFEVLGCIRVQFKADSRNERSTRAIERIGAMREGLLRNHMIMPDGVIRNSVYFSIIESEWPAVKDRLESLMARRGSDTQGAEK